jgi:O-antigen ligase
VKPGCRASHRAAANGQRPPGWRPAVIRPGLPSPSPAVVHEEATNGNRVAFVAFCLQTIILVGRPQDYIPALAALRPAFVLTFASLVLAVVQNQGGDTSPFRRRETKLFLFFVAAMMVSTPFGIYPRRSFEYLVGYVVNVIFFLLFVHHVHSVARFKQIVLTLVITALAFATLGLSQGEFYDGRYATVSTMFDPNDLGFVVISLLAFPLIALLGRFSIGSKLLAMVAVMCGLLLVLFSGSRGGLLGLATFLLLFLVLPVSSVGKPRKVLIIVVLAAVTVLNADKINVERYLTIREIGQDYNVTDEEGRAMVWKRGLDIFRMHPLTGVGVENFGEAIGTVRLEMNERPRWQAAHNSYLQVLAETGILGSFAFLALLISSLSTLLTLARRRQALAGTGLESVPVLLLVGLVAQLVTAFFLSQAYSVLFCLTVAVPAALRHLAQSAKPMAVSVGSAPSGRG